MEIFSKFKSKTPTLFYTKPYIKCEKCLETPLKCKKCLLEMMSRFKPPQTLHLLPINPNFKINREVLHRKNKPKNPKHSLKDVIEIIPKNLKLKEEVPEEFLQDFLKTSIKNNEFLPKLPQKIFNHKYIMLPEENHFKRKAMPNIGTGTEILIRMKDKKKNNTRQHENIDLFYRKKE